jgi:flagellar basal-body rod modification protein FlgD
MTVNSVSSSLAASSATTGSQNTALNGLSKNFDNFLLLLTQQLKAQDPLSPMDANQFTEQLVQFTGVEQAIATNDKLDKLIGAQTATQAATAISYLGTSITATTDQIALADGEASFDYELPADADRVAIIIADSKGKIVRADVGEPKAGKHSFSWDGEDNAGGDLPEGVYQVQVAALDANGEKIDSTVTTTGRVTGVEIRDGQIVLSMGDLEVPFDSLLSVRPAGS